jgi:hypothetical protein
MGDILKEAIADAKAVRETALENAKMALEEAFTPQIKSMLSAKLKEDEMGDDEAEEGMHDDEAEEGRHEEGEHDDDEEAEEGMREEDDEDEAEEGMREDDDEEAEEGMHDEDDDMDEGNLDLEAIIKELEDELSEGEHEDEAEEGEDMDESTEAVEEEYEIDEAALEEDEETVEEEYDKSSGIGKGDNSVDKVASSGIGSGKKGMKESSDLEAELKEYKEAVVFLKDKLHEVNILNAKLLFTNKLFKQYSLDNNQKLKVVETFDRAQTTREIKLVYSTLAEQFNYDGSTVTKKSISESASAAVGSTKPSDESRKVISEETQVADRFRKLAGLIK